MTYEDYSAGGMMTTEPIVMSADYSVADALASVRAREVSPALASQVFVCRQPLETPTGRFIGMVHYQRLLREPPSTLLGSIVDTDTQGLNPNASLHEVSSYLASYNLLSVPVVDGNERLLGAVTVDDVLDHLLPENWRLEHRDSTRGTGPKLDLADVTGSEVSHGDIELDKAIGEVDLGIGFLLDGIKERKMEEIVYIIIFSDHGMGKTKGKIVLSKLWNSISENNVIDVQDLPNGLYVLNLENEKGRIAFKLIRS
jgi:CBS domain-containing protein